MSNNLFTLKVTDGENNILLNWSNKELFKEYLIHQRPILKKTTNVGKSWLGFDLQSNIDENINSFYQAMWSLALTQQTYDNLPESANILDIGSGVSIMDLLAYQYLNKSAKFYLLDKNEFSFKGTYFSTTHGHYHKWDTVNDAISTNQFNANDFVFLSPEDEWPAQFDLITSYASYLWHYPLEVYWEKIKNHLKINGKLVVDISMHSLNDKDVISIISDTFKSQPVKKPIKSTALGYNIHAKDPQIVGYRCTWTRVQ